MIVSTCNIVEFRLNGIRYKYKLIGWNWNIRKQQKPFFQKYTQFTPTQFHIQAAYIYLVISFFFQIEFSPTRDFAAVFREKTTFILILRTQTSLRIPKIPRTKIETINSITNIVDFKTEFHQMYSSKDNLSDGCLFSIQKMWTKIELITIDRKNKVDSYN